MKKIYLLLLCTALASISNSQTLQANFFANDACVQAPNYLTDLSIASGGTITSWLWNFGDGTTSTQQNPVHVWVSAGTYNITLTVQNDLGMSSVRIKPITINSKLLANFSYLILDSCSPTSKRVAFINKSQNTNGNYYWSFGDGAYSFSSSPTHTYSLDGSYRVALYATGLSGCGADTPVKFIQLPLNKPLVRTAGFSSLTANYECVDDSGWTNYYHDNNTPLIITDDTLLLSLKKNGNNIGTIGVSGFSVKVTATAGAGSNTAVLLTNPLITNASGFWVMNRYWEVTPTTQPTTPVGVRFYYNSQDLADVNGSFPSHNLTHQNLLFYKTVGGSPDPTSNLAGATQIISITNGTTPDINKWVYTDLAYNRHMAEFKVTGFSGGGGGATGNFSVLPVKLKSFDVVQNNQNAILNWSVENGYDISNYSIEKSENGVDFSVIKTIVSTENTISWVDKKALHTARKIFYRLKITNKDGSSFYGKTVTLNYRSAIDFFTVSPNPAGSYLVVNYGGSISSFTSISLFDTQGRNVWSKRLLTGSNERFSLPTLPAGQYHLLLTDNQQLLLSKNILIIN